MTTYNMYHCTFIAMSEQTRQAMYNRNQEQGRAGRQHKQDNSEQIKSQNYPHALSEILFHYFINVCLDSILHQVIKSISEFVIRNFLKKIKHLEI